MYISISLLIHIQGATEIPPTCVVQIKLGKW